MTGLKWWLRSFQITLQLRTECKSNAILQVYKMPKIISHIFQHLSLSDVSSISPFNSCIDNQRRWPLVLANRIPDDSCGLCQRPAGLGGRTDPDPGSDGEVCQHERPSWQRQRQLNQVSKHVSSLTEETRNFNLPLELLRRRRWATGLAQQSNMYGKLPCTCSIIYFGFVTNTTAYCLCRYRLHLLLLKSSMAYLIVTFTR